MARKKEPERYDINRQRIAKIAAELFDKNGMEGTKMESIAKDADMSKTTLYNYFKNKEEIKNYLSLQAMQAFYEELCIVKRFQKESLYDRFMQICDTLVLLKEKYPKEFDLLVDNICVDESVLETDDVLRAIYETGEQVNLLLLSFFEDVLAQNEKGVSLIFSQWGSLYGLITLAYNKENYIMQNMHLTKEEFLKSSFDNLFLALEKGN